MVAYQQSRYGGFRRQEFAVEKRDVIQVYIMPNGTHVVRAFTLRNFLFYGVDGIIITYEEVLIDRYLAIQTAQQYDIQRNRMNNQIVKQNKDLLTTHLCTVDIE